MRRHAIPSAMSVAVLLWLGLLVVQSPAQSGGSATSGSPAYASVGGTPTGRVMPPGFVGVSLEYSALHLYSGRDPGAINPVLVALLRNLAPGQAPVLRIGGDSTDATWWPVRGVIPPGGVTYRLTPGWLRTARALAGKLEAQLILGVNLADGRPALAAAEAQALLSGIGRTHVQALEIGNEPDVYGLFAWYRDRRGHAVYARSSSYSTSSFVSDFSRWRAAMPVAPLAGPAFAETSWMNAVPQFLGAEPALRLFTAHRYPLRAGTTDRHSPVYASIPNLLSDGASAGLAQSIAPYVAQVHAAGIPFRVDEMNSASNFGQRGVSNTFASALWALDTLFNMASVGVDGVNVHSLPSAQYELFTFSRVHGSWRAFVHPEYYGMMMFAQAFPPGARLLPVNESSGPVKVWATHGTDGRTRVVLINKDTRLGHQVELQMPGVAGSATLQWLRAPSASATSGVTWGGRSFGSATRNGTLPGPAQTQPIVSNTGSYAIDLPAASAVLLTH